MEIQIADKFQFLFRPKRIKVMFGGRGGAKTVSISKAALFMAAAEKKRILCLREFMNSIDDSVHSALKDEIETMGMSHLFNPLNTAIEGVNGSTFKYGQLARNLSSIKSKHDFDIAWIEEAETVSEKSIDVLEPTIRKAGSEVWYSFNPDDEFGAVYSRYVKPHLEHINKHGFYEDDELYVVKVGLEDNPFAPDELIHASNKMKAENYKKWQHIWGGEVFGDYKDAIIQPEWVRASIDAHKKLGFDALGVKALGFDPADTGDDAKAIVMRHGSVITKGMKWLDGDLSEAIDITFDYAYEWRSDFIVYDSDGLGRGVKVGLDKRVEGKSITVVPYGGNDKKDNESQKYMDDKTNKETFKNKRAQYWWYLRDRFEATYNAVEKGVYCDPEKLISLSSEIEDLDTLRAELSRVNRKRGANSFIQIESKEDMKKREVKSPNMADALVMCFANPDMSTKKKPVLTFASEF